MLPVQADPSWSLIQIQTWGKNLRRDQKYYIDKNKGKEF